MNLQLLQLGDSALPIGGYSHSWGLEAGIDCGTVGDPATLEMWVRSWLRFAVGPNEGVIVAAVCRAAAQGNWLAAIRANDLLWASLTPPTLRHASRDMGEQLLALAEAWPWAVECTTALRRAGGVSPPRGDQGLLMPPRGAYAPRSPDAQWHHAPVFATLAAAAGASPLEALSVYLHQAALGAIGAGVRAIPIGHTHGQQVLARLHPAIAELASELVERDLETAGSFGPAYEVLCHAQGRLYTRLFRS